MIRVIRARSSDRAASTDANSATFSPRSQRLSAVPSIFHRRTASTRSDAALTTPPPAPSPSSVPRPFDPLALVRRLPAQVSAPCFVKSARHLAVFSRFERYWLELRGRLVVMLLHDNIWAHPNHRLPPPPSDAVIAAVFTVERCRIYRRPKSPVLKISNPSNPHHVWLRFDTHADCYAWEKALTAVAAQRVVGISDFEFISPIGKGASGKVFLVSDRTTGEKLALKVIDKSNVFESRSAFRHALDERLALQMVDGHPFFSRLRYAFQTRAYFYLAIDFYDGGDLYQYLRTHHGRLTETQVRAVSAEVLLALDHLHSLGFVYRDLKPENVLLDSNGHVRLADFGLCKLLPEKGLTNTICGTHTYAAPEILSARSYGMSIDLWAYGVFVYHILRGRTPYEARDLDQVIANMSNRRIRFSSSTSPELVSMIKKLLDWNPDTRLGCGPGGMVEVRGHSFFKGLDWRKVYLRDEELPGLFVARTTTATSGIRTRLRTGRAREGGVSHLNSGLVSWTSSGRVTSEAGDGGRGGEGGDSAMDVSGATASKASGVGDMESVTTGVIGEAVEGNTIGAGKDGRSARGEPSELASVETESGTQVSTRAGVRIEDIAAGVGLEEVSANTGGQGQMGDVIRERSGVMKEATGAGRRRWAGSIRGMSGRGDSALSGRSGRTESVTLREQMVAAAEQDDLRNFDMSEWGKISVDIDHDDIGYGDGALWPFARARRKLVEEERMIAGFGYCSSSSGMVVPDNL